MVCSIGSTSATKIVRIMTDDLDLFQAKVKCGHFDVCMRKGENKLFLETVAALGLKVG